MSETNYYGVQPNNVRDVESRYRYITNTGQTAFPANYTIGYVDVYYGGVKLDPGVAFSAVNGTSIILSSPATAGITVEIISRRQVPVTTGVALPSVATSSYTAIDGQTVFTLTSGVYIPGSGSLIVYMNGLKLRSVVDYTESSSTTFTLISGANLGDEIDCIVGTLVSPSNGSSSGLTPVMELYTATAGQTAFSTVNSYTLSLNTIDVYVNGISYNLGVDYTETSSNLITFTTGLSLGDEVKFKIWRTGLTPGGDASIVTYVPAGTGAVATTVERELHRRVNVCNFADGAALGTDITAPHYPLQDWTGAIQKAVNYIQNTGAVNFVSTHSTTLYFPAGLYFIFGTVTVSGGMSFEGDGGPASYVGSNLQSANDGITPKGHAIFTFDSNAPASLYFSKLSFNDSGADVAPDVALVSTTGIGGRTNSVYFRDCWFKGGGSTQYGATFGSPIDDLQFFGCTFDSTHRNGIGLGSQLNWTTVTTTGTAGQFSCAPSGAVPLTVNGLLTIGGVLSGTGSISGYTNGKTYHVIATDGVSTFQLSETGGGTPITTTAGTLTGLTFNLCVLNVSIIGCDFYSDEPSVIGNSFIEVNCVKNLLISGNRFWADPGKTMTNAIKFTSNTSQRVVIEGNTSQGCVSFASIGGTFNIVSNNSAYCTGTPLIIIGPYPFSYNSIIGNVFAGGPSSGYGVIDATGVLMSGTVIQGNVLFGNGTGPGLNMPTANYTSGGNAIRGNTATGCTADGSNGFFTFTPSLVYSGGGGTFGGYNQQTGTYIIANGFVVLEFVITLNGTAGTVGVGNIQIAGLPIAVGSVPARGPVLLGGVTFPTGCTSATISGQSGSSNLDISFSGSGAAFVIGLPPANITASATIAGSITYAY